MHEAENSDDEEQSPLTPPLLKDLAKWLYSPPKACVAYSSLWIGRAGFAAGLLSCVFMLFLGKDFATRLKIPLWLAYTLSTFSAVPLSILLAQNVQKVLSLLVVSILPTTDADADVRRLLFEKTNSTIRFCTCLSQLLFCLLLALTPTVPLTYLSHIKIQENTARLGYVASLVLAIVFDFFAFVPRIILFRMAIQNISKRFIALLKSEFAKRNISEVDRSKLRVLKHIASIDNLLNRVGDDSLKKIETSYLDGSKEKKLQVLLSLPTKYPELSKASSKHISALLNTLALVIGALTSYVIVPLAISAYQAIYRGMVKTSSQKIPLTINVLGGIGAWIGAITFTSLIYTAATKAFLRFYYTFTRFKNGLKHGHKVRGCRSLSSLGRQIIPTTLVGLASMLAFISVFPRIEVNVEQFKFSSLGPYLSIIMKIIFDVGSGIGYFSLDFWPLSDTLRRLSRQENTRDKIRLPITKLLTNVGSFNRKTIQVIEGTIQAEENDDSNVSTSSATGIIQ